MKKLLIVSLFAVLALALTTATITITASNNAFTPNPASAAPGDTIFWTFNGNYNVAQTNSTGGIIPGGFSSLAGASNYTFMIPSTGYSTTYYYVCTIVSGMSGSITVTPTSGVASLIFNFSALALALAAYLF